MNTDKRQKVKNDLLNAAIKCMSTQGITGATVRAIASVAGVNMSAVSYYFGSRENLINQALTITLDHAFDLSDIVIKTDDNYHIVLKRILLDWETGVKAYPGITHAHFDEVLNDHINGKIVSERLNLFISQVFDLLVNHGLIENTENFAKLKAVFGSFISSIIMPSVLKPTIEDDRFVDLLVEMI